MRVRSGLLLAAVVAVLVFAGIALAADDPPTPVIADEPAPRVGETLSASGATIFKWQRCDPGTDPCAADASQNASGWQNITGQESDPSTYTLTLADEGMMIRVLGKDTNEGTKFAPSNRVGPVAPSSPASINVTKELVPSDDTGRFDLKVDDEVVADDASAGDSGTRSNLSPGTYTVSELAGTGTGLGDYNSSVECTGEGDAQPGTSMDVTVAAGENVECTITNTRPPPPPPEEEPVEPIAPPPPPDEEPLRPSFQRTGTLEPLEGNVLFKLPGSNQWVELEEVINVPMGTKVDVSNGHALLITQKKPSGELQSIELWAGAFILQQKRKNNMTVLTLANSFADAVQARAGAETERLRKKKKRRLWGRGKCRCRHRGRNSSGTSRGTWWLTAELPKGTLTKVRKGKVKVRDFKRRKKVLVKAGEKYLARR